MSDTVEERTAKINFHVADKIGLANYSNVSYGISITRDVPDTGSAADLRPYVDEIVAEVEAFAAEERSKILEMIQGGSIAVEKKGK